MEYPIKSMVDIQKAHELVRINGDLGRFGGLLKLWLSDDAKTAELSAAEIRHLLAKVEETQAEMHSVLKEILMARRQR